MSDQLSQLCDCVTLVDTETFSNLLSSQKHSLPDLKTPDGKNSKFHSVFHLLSVCDSKEDTILKFLNQTISFVFFNQLEANFPSSQVESMLNSPSKSLQRTPLFEAVWFNKRVTIKQKIVKRFIECKADPSVRDKDGQSLLHACTICGHLSLLAYFSLTLKLQIDTLDLNSRTPLHVAVFEGKEAVSAFLIAYSKDFELRDRFGFTVLHLAAFTNAYRTVRHLVMRGAKRKAGTPHFRSFEIGEIMTVNPDVLELLKEPSCFKYLNPISPPLDKVSNSRKTFALNLTFFVVRVTFLVLFQYPRLGLLLVVFSLCLVLMSLSFLMLSSFVKPGYAEPGNDLPDLYASYKEEDICAYCCILREKSMKHCYRCNKCVKKFDHHCPWIHNCVGQGNHKFFYFYVLFTDLDFLFHSISAFIAISGNGETGLFQPFVDGDVLADTVNLIFGVLTILLFFALAPLVYVQTVNLITGLTTHDRFARRNGARDSRVSHLSLPFFDSEQIPMSLLEPNSAASSVVKEIKAGFCGCSKAVSFVKDFGIEEMQYTSSLRP